MKILSKERRRRIVVVDPFCGRGTTLFAARRLGFHAFGLDSNPTAVAIASAKLSDASPDEIIRAYDRIIATPGRVERPEGEFWQWAFHPKTLDTICKLRASLVEDCRSPARKALRGLLLGILHGPLAKRTPGYLSNQMPRTFASKPDYSVRYWQKNDMRPPEVDVRGLVARKAFWFFGRVQRKANGRVNVADSRSPVEMRRLLTAQRVDWVITSPPYFGMRTYRTDQWLRLWCVGGAPEPDYAVDGQLSHKSRGRFEADLRSVWSSLEAVAKKGCKMVIRFGSISERSADPIAIIRESLKHTAWRISTVCKAGSAADGHRQADAFQLMAEGPKPEFDIWTRKEQ